MLFQHSFWYRASQRSFEAALKADPGCGIAYWGIALSLLWNPHTAPPVKNLADGAAAITKGKEVGARTERERDYIAALGAMYTDYDKVDHRTRVLNYLNAMEQLAAKYPNDDEAQIHYALALNVGASPSDKTYTNQLKGAAILEKIWDRQPDHPGIAHYLIHLYDTPVLAEKGLTAARRYAKVAPDGATLFFVSNRDGFHCIWAQKLEPATKHPAGVPFAVYHQHSARRSTIYVAGGLRRLAAARNKVVFTMGERTGNIWIADLPNSAP